MSKIRFHAKCKEIFEAAIKNAPNRAEQEIADRYWAKYNNSKDLCGCCARPLPDKRTPRKQKIDVVFL